MPRQWRPAPEGTFHCFDHKPVRQAVAAYAVEGEDEWVLTEDGRVLRVNRERGDRLVFPGDPGSPA